MKKSAVLAIFSLMTLAAIGSLVYFTVWRPTDDDYAAAMKNIDEARQSAITINQGVRTFERPDAVNESSVDLFSGAVKNYQDKISEIGKSAVTRDFTFHAELDQHKQSLDAFGQSAKKILRSLRAYHAVASSCANLIDSLDKIFTAAAFDSSAKNCRASLDEGASTPDTSFKSQFFDEYLSLMKKLVVQYKDLIEASGNDERANAFNSISETKASVGEMKDIRLTFAIAENPTKALEKLSVAADTQRTRLFR